MDHNKAMWASIRCWKRLVRAIENLPDDDRKQYELDKIFKMECMQRTIDIL